LGFVVSLPETREKLLPILSEKSLSCAGREEWSLVTESVQLYLIHLCISWVWERTAVPVISLQREGSQSLLLRKKMELR
jgi:hypothetical protein